MTVAVPVEGPYNVVDFTVPDGTTIEKNTLCMISGSRTAVAGTGLAPPFAGIAMIEKKAGSGAPNLGQATTGIFNIETDANLSEGMLVVISGSNLIEQAAAAHILSGSVVGKILADVDGRATTTAVETKLGIY